MPGAPVFHGYPTSTTGQGMGGAARIDTAEITSHKGTDMGFFVWLFVLGILLPGLVIGGLKVGGFQFVFKHR